jgi:Arc/MetJ-type ribon-helix-helix transcriptional regulator
MKTTISATIDTKLIDWIEAELKDKTKYRNKSHLIEIAISRFRENARR